PASPLDEHGLLDKCRDLGVKLLQVGDNLPLHEFSDARLAHLAERAAREGVKLEVGARRLTAERVAEYAALARRVSARLIRFVIDDVDYHPAPPTVTKALREAVPLLDGLTLGVENHDRFDAGTLRGLIESAGSERVGVCLDTANSLGAGEGLDAVVTTLAPFVVNLHLKDFHIARLPHLMGFTITGRPAGDGFLNVRALLKQLGPFGRCQTAVLELWTPPEPRLEDTIAKEAAWAGKSVAWLREFIQDQPCQPRGGNNP